VRRGSTKGSPHINTLFAIYDAQTHKHAHAKQRWSAHQGVERGGIYMYTCAQAVEAI
jgi:hypothetical protein